MRALLCLLLFATVNHATEWNQTTRDVWVDGELRVDARVYATGEPARLAIVIPDRKKALVAELESGKLARVALSEALGETSWEATSNGRARPSRGHATRIDNRRLLIEAGRTSILLSSHVGPVGEIARDTLFESVPLWAELAANWQPDPELIDRLRAIDRELTLDLTFGTWCGDSRRAVPRLLKSLDIAANPKLTLTMTALSNDFDRPIDVIAARQLTNVPTLRILDGDEELDRIVETPAGESFAEDLATIAEGSRPIHSGRWEREAKLGSGRLVGDDGVEEWELWSDEEGGTLLHATLERDGVRLETWHRRDEQGRSAFVELTRTAGPHHTRTRAWAREEGVTVVTRGDASGIVRQRLPAGELITPSRVDAAGVWRALDAPDRWSGQAWLVDGRPAARAARVEIEAAGQALRLRVDAAPACHLTADPILGVVLSIEGCRRAATERIEREP